jgi:hypothetical protein
MEEGDGGGCWYDSLNKCGYLHSGELGVELLHLAGLGGEGVGELDVMYGRQAWKMVGKLCGYKCELYCGDL